MFGWFDGGCQAGVMRGLLLVGWFWLGPVSLSAAELFVGGASVSITPDRPVALAGQMRTRIAQRAEAPVIATGLAIETRDGENVVDQAVFVSCDLVAIREGLLDEVRGKLKDRLPGFDLSKIILNATHTHTAPVMRSGQYQIPDNIMQPEEYREFLTDQLADCIVKCRESLQPGQVSWGLGHAVVAYNRRAVYADGKAKMYGSTSQDDFRNIEGYEDQGVEILCFWDRDDHLLGTIINVASPSQVVEGLSVIHADFWHFVREQLQAKHGKELLVVPWTGAAGDQAPRPMFRKSAEERMRKLKGISPLEDIAGRIVHAWEQTLPAIEKDKQRDVVFKHVVKEIQLSPRVISVEDYQAAVAGVAAQKDNPDAWRRMWHQGVIDRYELQKQGELPAYPMELHVLRLGDVAIASNQFEYFTDFGIQIKARSKAMQTFLVQLAGPGSYVPTQKAVTGGSYSAIAESNQVGPEGGQELVEITLETIKSLW